MDKSLKIRHNKQYSVIMYLVLVMSLISNTNHAQVSNAGISGNTTGDLLHRLDHDVLDKNPDLVILMAGTNDMVNSNKMVSYQDCTENLEKIVHEIKETGSEVLLLSPPPVDTVYLLERHDRKAYDQPPNTKLDSVSQIMRLISSENNILFLDLGNKFRAKNLPQHNQDLYIRNPKNSGVRDGVHPTVLGYLFIAETIFKFLIENNIFQK